MAGRTATVPGRVLNPIIDSIIGRGRQSRAQHAPLALLVDDARGDGVGVMTTTRASWDDKPDMDDGDDAAWRKRRMWRAYRKRTWLRLINTN